MSMPKVRATMLADIEQWIVALCRQHGMGDVNATAVSDAFIDKLTSRWGGRVISFPRDTVRNRQRRTMKAVGMFDGANYGHIARELGMTERGVRKMLAKAARAGDLP